MSNLVKIKGSIKNIGKVPNRIEPDPKWGNTYEKSDGFTALLAEKLEVYIFTDQRLLKKDKSVTEKESTVARIISKSPKINWRVDAEPIKNNKLGLIAYNDKGKAQMSGIYDLEKSTCDLQSLYPGITNRCKQKVTVTAKHKAGGTEIGGTVEIEHEDP